MKKKQLSTKCYIEKQNFEQHESLVNPESELMCYSFEHLNTLFFLISSLLLSSKYKYCKVYLYYRYHVLSFFVYIFVKWKGLH